jgi:hypothetical protein
MVDRARPEVLEWDVGGAITTLRGRHHGFEALRIPATHTRTLRLDAARRLLELEDEVLSEESHELTWSYPLAPCRVELRSSTAIARFGEITLSIHFDGPTATVEQGWLAPRYGARIPAPVVRLRSRSNPGGHVQRVVLRIDKE